MTDASLPPLHRLARGSRPGGGMPAPGRPPRTDSVGPLHVRAARDHHAAHGRAGAAGGQRRSGRHAHRLERRLARRVLARERGAPARHAATPELPELRAAEEQACSGLAEADRDASPFLHRNDIIRVEPIERGVRVRIRHVDGLTADWLEHLVECHLARDEVIGPDAPDTKDSPLAVHGATAHVAADAEGYVVEVRSDDSSGAEEIARRARALHP